MSTADRVRAPIPRLVLGRDIFTTGQVSSLLGCAPRTVSKHIDAGRLKGWRAPGSQDRRVPRAALVAFFRDNGVPLPALLAPTRRVACLVGAAPEGVEAVATFELARLAHAGELLAVVLGCDFGLDAALDVARGLRAACPDVPVGLVLGEDRRAEDVPAGLFDRVFSANPNGELSGWLRGPLAITGGPADVAQS